MKVYLRMSEYGLVIRKLDIMRGSEEMKNLGDDLVYVATSFHGISEISFNNDL